MPTYVYACKNCGHRFEQRQSFTDDALVTCPACGQDALRKVYDSVGVVFKGPGFYSTDSAKGSGGTSAGGSAAGTGDAASGAPGSTTKASGTPGSSGGSDSAGASKASSDSGSANSGSAGSSTD